MSATEQAEKQAQAVQVVSIAKMQEKTKSVRLVRVEYIAIYEARDEDGDPTGPPLVYSGDKGQPVHVIGKEIAGLYDLMKSKEHELLMGIQGKPKE